MKELSPHPDPQDIHLMSIVDEMSKKYLDVSVLRGKRDMIFIYSLDLQFKRLGESMKFKKEIRVTRIEIEKCQALGVIPKKIKNLLAQ
jgi:hypothetical protein